MICIYAFVIETIHVWNVLAMIMISINVRPALRMVNVYKVIIQKATIFFVYVRDVIMGLCANSMAMD
jgi:hypothetical protein